MAKFCTRCGNALPEDGSACPCTLAAQPPLADAGPGYNTPNFAYGQQGGPGQNYGQPNTGYQPGAYRSQVYSSSIVDASIQGDPALVLGGARIKYNWIFVGLGVILAIFFFIPMWDISLLNMGFSELTFLIGKKMEIWGYEQTILDPNFMAIFFLLIPLAIAALYPLQKTLKLPNLITFIVSAGLCTFGFFFVIFFGVAAGGGGEAARFFGTTFAFWFVLLLYLIGAGLSVLGAVFANKR